MKRVWTRDEANAWYAAQPWLRGCNFIGSDCASRIDQWQSYRMEEHLATADREMAACEKLGMNTVRLIVEFDVWVQEPQSFMRCLDRYIALAAKHRQLVMLVLANEAVLCRGTEYTPRALGEQKYALGYHQGRFPLGEEEKARPPVHPLETDKWRDRYLEMVRDIVRAYAKDDRVVCWNVYNEPGIMLEDRAEPLLRLLFDAVRAEDPVQPLCADIWRGLKDGGPRTLSEKTALALSDVISYHTYSCYEQVVLQLEALGRYGRPILVTEWLNRINHNTVAEIYPLFYLENVANWCWGCVAGKTQTYEPWDALWEQYENGSRPDLDFTKWQHDLFRPSLRPYDPHETELIKKFNALADERHGKK